MPRRFRPERREVKPDLRYDSVLVSMFVNRLMYNGKKSLAYRLFYNSLDLIEKQTGKSSIEVFESALKNTTPHIEVKPRRVGGATYQVPMEISPHRQTTLAMRWLLQAARARKSKSMVERLASEFIDASNNQGSAVKRKDDTHKMAEANRAFSHYKF